MTTDEDRSSALLAKVNVRCYFVFVHIYLSLSLFNLGVFASLILSFSVCIYVCGLRT